MTDLRKAAEMALETAILIANSNWRIGKYTSSPEEFERWARSRANHIASILNQALEQHKQYDQTALELCDVCGWKAVIPDEGCLVCARKNLKPVGTYEEVMDTMLSLAKGTFEQQQVYIHMKDKPLYTAPPKSKWVGLTDEEVEAWRGNYDFFDSALVREVEAKLKEKNS